MHPSGQDFWPRPGTSSSAEPPAPCAFRRASRSSRPATRAPAATPAVTTNPAAARWPTSNGTSPASPDHSPIASICTCTSSASPPAQLAQHTSAERSAAVRDRVLCRSRAPAGALRPHRGVTRVRASGGRLPPVRLPPPASRRRPSDSNPTPAPRCARFHLDFLSTHPDGDHIRRDGGPWPGLQNGGVAVGLKLGAQTVLARVHAGTFPFGHAAVTTTLHGPLQRVAPAFGVRSSGRKSKSR